MFVTLPTLYATGNGASVIGLWLPRMFYEMKLQSMTKNMVK